MDTHVEEKERRRGAGSLARILLVDDDRNLLELVRMKLESAHYEVETAIREEEALKAVSEQRFDLSIVDLRLLRRDGITLMEEFHSLNPEMPVIILTGYGNIESAVEAMKRGAYSYLTKPLDPRELILRIEKTLEERKLSSEVQRLKGLLEERYDFGDLVSRSEKMDRVLEVVSRIAKTDSTIYIQGESGTGKELIAQAVHIASPRKHQPFVAINCAALPESLLESELFGHEKGAFTEAIRTTKGLFLQAQGGTLFLDEIGDMPLSLQAKLLRVLQDKRFYPVGGEKPVEVDVRVVVATKKDLEEETKKGLFREDLFYRIHVIPIHLPPLRERKEDIPPLVAHFLEKLGYKMKKDVKRLTPEAMQKLMLHDWPGNVRELENTIERAVAMTEQNVVTEDLIFQTNLIPQEEELSPMMVFPDLLLKPFKEAKDTFERNYLIRLLELAQGNVSQAARLAGKHRSDFYDLLRKHSLKTQDFKKSRHNYG
jgi:two-component system, NtrC family, response regulator GlrR